MIYEILASDFSLKIKMKKAFVKTSCNSRTYFLFKLHLLLPKPLNDKSFTPCHPGKINFSALFLNLLPEVKFIKRRKVHF